MSAHAEFDPARPAVVPSGGVLGVAQSLLDRVNAVAAALSGIAAGAAGCVLTWEVVGRYFLKIPSEWQDELSIFLLVGATFLSAGWIQARRGHVGTARPPQFARPAPPSRLTCSPGRGTMPVR